MTAPTSRAVVVGLIALSVLLFGVLRAPYISVPLERDEGEYAYVAQRMLAGDVPYRDAFDQKPPGVFLVYAAAFVAFGESIEGIHAAMYLWTAVTGLLLLLLVRRLAGDLAGALGLLIFSVASIDSAIMATAANTEIFMLLPVTASTLCMLRALEGGRPGWWLACGALAAGACWFKQVAGVHVAFLMVFAFGDLLRRGGGVRATVRPLALLGTGAVAISLPIAAWFALAGAWEEFIDAVFLHNLAYSRNVSWSQGLAQVRWSLGRQVPGSTLFWILAASAMVVPAVAPARVRVLLAGWTLASAVGVSVGLYFRPHYFVQLLPPICAAAGIGAAWVAARLGRWSPLPRTAGLLAGLVLLLAPPVYANRAALWAGSPNAVARRIYGLNPFPESLEIAKYIRRTSSQGDSIYVVGSEPQIFFYSGRRSATRYIIFYPLTGGFPDAKERQRQVMREVSAARPRYVVVANLHTSLMVDEQTEGYIFAATRRFLERHYELEFVALPVADERGYDLIYGREAQGVMEAPDPEDAPAAWVAVYRRES